MTAMNSVQLFKIGNLYKKNGKFKEAIQIFGRCIDGSDTTVSRMKEFVHQDDVVKHILLRLDAIADYRLYYNIAVCYCDWEASLGVHSNQIIDTDFTTQVSYRSIASEYLNKAADLCADTVACMQQLMRCRDSETSNVNMTDGDIAKILQQYPQVGRAKPCLEDILLLQTGLYIKLGQPEASLRVCIILLKEHIYCSNDAESSFRVETESGIYTLPVSSPSFSSLQVECSAWSVPVECMYNLNVALRQLGAMKCAIDYSWYIFSLSHSPQTGASASLLPLTDFKAFPSSFSQTISADDNLTTVRQTGATGIPLAIICVKWGTKYNHIYVNNLFHSLRKYMPSVPFVLFCLTESSEHIHEDVVCIDIWVTGGDNVTATPTAIAGTPAATGTPTVTATPIVTATPVPTAATASTEFKGWWVKILLFSSEVEDHIRLKLQTIGKIPVVYFDLDILICNPINDLVNNWVEELYNNGNISSKNLFITLNASSLQSECRCDGFNSSIMVYNLGSMAFLYEFLLLTSSIQTDNDTLHVSQLSLSNFTQIQNVVYKFDHYLEMMLLSSGKGYDSKVGVCYIQDISNSVVDYRSLDCLLRKPLNGVGLDGNTDTDNAIADLSMVNIVVFPLYPKPHHLIRNSDLLPSAGISIGKDSCGHYIQRDCSASCCSDSVDSISTNNRHWVCDYWHVCHSNKLM